MLQSIANKITRYISPECITYNIREHGGFRQCSLEVDTGTTREEILKHLQGIGYRESYGIFTTEFNEIFITDVLDVTPEISLLSLLYDEDHIISNINSHLRNISRYNIALRKFSIFNKERSETLRKREDEIKALEAEQLSLTKIRKEIQHNYNLRLPKGEETK